MITYADLVKLAEDYCGEEREAPGPGKFEGCHDLRLAEALYEVSLDTSWLDEDYGYGDGGGWFGRIGRFLVSEDSQGFFDYADYETEDAAHAAFTASLPDEG